MMIGLLFLAFGGLLALGMPIVFGIGVSTLFALLASGEIPLSVMITKIVGGMDSFPLMAIPFFVLAGEVMNRAKITESIMDFASDLVGHFRGGLAHATVVSEIILSGISGSGTADCAALGSIVIPTMVRKGYPVNFTVCLTACAACLGPIIPPSMTMIVYGAMTGVSIGALFFGGIIPGVVMGLGLMLLAHLLCLRGGFGAPAEGASFRHLGVSFLRALPALLGPGIILGGILGGIFTATEAGIVAVVYSVLVGLFVLKTIKLGHIFDMLVTSALTSGMVMFLLGVASIFGYLMTRWHFQDVFMDLLQMGSSHPGVIMAEIMLLLYVLGGIMDETPMIIMLAPALAGVGTKLGFDPVHFGVFICCALVLGAVIPPVATFLFVSCSIARIPLSQIMRPIWLWLLPLMVAVALTAYFPSWSTAIPSLLMH